MVWLHGTLELSIVEAKDLPGERVGKLGGNVIGKYIEKGIAKIKAGNCYAVLNIVTPYQISKSRFRTGVITSHHPKWNEKVVIDVADDVEKLQFVIKDDDIVGADFVGQFEIAVDKLVKGEALEGDFPLTDARGEPLPASKTATVKLAVKYTSMDKSSVCYKTGTGCDGEVPRVFFPLRKGNRVHLYNDAHHEVTGPNSKIPLSNGSTFEERSCWNDLYKDLQAAKHFIYVAGWSVVDHVHLVRDFSKSQQEGPTIGELLKEKADKDKLKVCMLIWDDQTSTSVTGGVMMTKDEETKKYFKHSDVECVLCPRKTGHGESLIKGLATTTLFTHHQKLVVMDAPPKEGSEHRTIVAYVGGLDLTTGRFDTPDHYLFKTLHTVHKDDFYQGCIAGIDQTKGGPRQPWHDIHSRLEGPIAWDVLENFHQRWEKQGGLTKRHKIMDWRKCPQIFHPDHIQNKHGDAKVMVLPPEDPESWNVQLFRTIDSNSVGDVFPEDNKTANEMGLQTGKGTTKETSIHSAYVHAIRRAQRFLFIENQYFLGSSQNWPTGEHPGGGCDHLIPVEIALKVCSKIKAGEPFVAYIIIPPHPEGNPHDGSVQEILYWQAQTMRMMYALVADAIMQAGAKGVPTDYLQFFFVGKREPVHPDEVAPETACPEDCAQGKAQKSRRHMIYVHSKMMIVDDEYIIVGSANINMRSMHGSRDSEIAIGAYQPKFTLEAAGGLPAGQVHGFRMSLWEEHTGTVDKMYADPSTMQCAQAIKSLAKKNWEVYSGDEVKELPHGHLCMYPLNIKDDGTVENLPGVINFPDTEASILGGNKALPDALTT
jgi:phospholipase D1/2